MFRSLRQRLGPATCGADDQEESTHAWRRWYWMWHALFYGSLSLSTIVAMLDLSGSDRLAVLPVIAGCAVWYWFFIIRHPAWRWSVPARLAGYGLMVLLFAGTTFFHPVFMLVTFSMYVLVFSLFELRVAIPAAVVLSLLIGWRNAAFSGQAFLHDPAAIGGILLSLAFGVPMTLFIDAIIRQSEERQRLIDELTEARDELDVRQREATIVEERQRMAREIHDTLAQGFTSIVMHLEAADQLLPAELTRVRHHVDQARSTARDSLTEARRLVWALRPEPLEGTMLPDAVARVARRWSLESGTRATTTTTGEFYPLHPEIEIAVLRVVQEALANVRKHAGATQVVITLSYFDDQLILDVKDDGVGFAQELVAARQPGYLEGGYGLTAMRERVEALGGTLVVESSPGEGTGIAVAVPLSGGSLPETTPTPAAVATT